MKRKAILCLLLAAMTLFSASAAHADLFPSLKPGNKPTPAPQTEEAPSYGAFANVDYTAVQPYGESGQTVYSYENVTEENYTAFGNYLGQKGFQVTASEVEETTVQMQITDGHFNIGVVYYGDQQELLVIYEAGAVPAKKALFPGYTKLKMNQEIVIKNLGKFTFTKLQLNGPAVKTVGLKMWKRWFDDWRWETITIGFKEKSHLTCLTFKYFNTRKSDVEYAWSGESSYKYNSLFDVWIVYANENNSYLYEQARYGTYADGIVYCTKLGDNYDSNTHIGAFATKPLTWLNGGVVFDLPDAVRTATDGTLAILLQFKTGEKYYIPIREDGVAVK